MSNDFLPMSAVRKGLDLDVSQIHVARAETDLSHAYVQAQNDYGAADWFPIYPANQITGYVYKWRKDMLYRNWATRWQPGANPHQARLSMDDKAFYQLDWRAVEYGLPNHLQGAADPGINLDDAITRLVTNTLLIEREKTIFDSFFKTGVWSIDITGVATPGEVDATHCLQFDAPGSKPRDIMAYLKVALDRKALMPNVAVMSFPVFEKLRVHPQLLTWYAAFQQPGIAISELNENIVAQALGLEKIVVTKAKYTTSEEGCDVDDIVLEYIADSRGMWLGHVDTPGLMSSNSGMLIAQNFDSTVKGGVEVAIERVPDLRTHVEYLQGFTCYQPLLLGKDLGMFLDHIISAEAAAGTA